jgi:hypothetical protein
MFTSSDRRALNSAIAEAAAARKDASMANSRISSLNSTVSSLSSTVSTANSRLSTLHSKADTASAEAKEARSAANAVTSRVNTLSSTVSSLNSRVNTDLSKINSAWSTAVGAKAQADKAMQGVVDLRNDRNGMSETLNSTMKFLDEVAANVNNTLPGMNVSIKNLQTDMNAIKLSMLVQTCGDMGTQQGDLRLYTSEECNAMNGIYQKSGECNKKEGGSFSYDCGMLYKGKNVGTKSVNTNAVANNTGMETFNWVKEPFNWSKEPGGNSDIIGTAFRVAAKMGLRASIVSSTKESGWSLPIGSEYEYMDALDAADNMFIQFLGNNLSPGEAAREAATAAAETEYRMRVLSASLEAAHRLGLGSKKVNQTSTGWSLPLGQYSPTEAIAADNAFQQTIAGAATPFRPTEQEGRAAADAAQFIARLRKIAFEMGLGLKSNGVLAYHGYSLPLGKYSPTAAIAADLKFKEAYLAGASPADAAAAALLKAKALEPQTKVNALEPQTKVNALEPQTSGPVAANAKAASGANAAAKDRWGAWTGTLFNRLGGRRKRTTRGKSRRRGTRRSRR